MTAVVAIKTCAHVHEKVGGYVETIYVSATKAQLGAEAEKVEDGTLTSEHVLHINANA
jgi:hypothetical protein